jgi:hypothetical protein
MFWRKKPQPSTVALFDLGSDGAALSWNGDDSRAVALDIFVELARRLERQDRVERLRLSGLVGSAIDVADRAAFIRAAPELLQRKYRAYEFEFRLNDGHRGYRVRHLDQSTPGIAFDTPVEGEPFWSTLQAVLLEQAAKPTGVKVSTGPWYESDNSSRAEPKRHET